MSQISPILREAADGVLSFFCPGCKDIHSLRTSSYGSESRWTWNGNATKPTFFPSILATNGHHSPRFKPGDPCWCTYAAEHPEEEKDFKCQRCHSYVTDGQILFLSDSTHELACTAVPLPELPGWSKGPEEDDVERVQDAPEP